MTISEPCYNSEMSSVLFLKPAKEEGEGVREETGDISDNVTSS